MPSDKAEIEILSNLQELTQRAAEGFVHQAAEAVRAAFAALEPEAVAVEIPSSLGRTWQRAVERLPAISVLLYETASGETVYLPIHPADAMAEAARGALERGIPLACADLDVVGYADWRDPFPDAYAIHRLGPLTVWDAFRRHPRVEDAHDAPRESSMAFHARRLREAGASRVLVTHGWSEALARYLAETRGLETGTIRTAFEGEAGELTEDTAAS